MEPSIYSSAPYSEGAVRRASFLHHCCQTRISISREYKTHWTLRRYIYHTLLTYLPWTTGHSPVVLLTLQDTSDISIWINASYGDCETRTLSPPPLYHERTDIQLQISPRKGAARRSNSILQWMNTEIPAIQPCRTHWKQFSAPQSETITLQCMLQRSNKTNTKWNKSFIFTLKRPWKKRKKEKKKREEKKKKKEKDKLIPCWLWQFLSNWYLADYDNFCQSTSLDRETGEYYEQQLCEMQNHGCPLHQPAGISNEATPRVNECSPLLQTTNHKTDLHLYYAVLPWQGLQLSYNIAMHPHAPFL